MKSAIMARKPQPSRWDFKSFSFEPGAEATGLFSGHPSGIAKEPIENDVEEGLLYLEALARAFFRVSWRISRWVLSIFIS